MTVLEQRALARLNSEDYATVLRDYEDAITEQKERREATERYWRRLAIDSGEPDTAVCLV